MKIAVLHSSNQGFFPRFYSDLCKSADASGDEIHVFGPVNGNNKRRPLNRQTLWGNKLNWFVHYNLYRITGLQDIFSLFCTIDLIRRLKVYNPDIFHLNVMNEWNTCFPLLKWYLNKTGKPVVWTFHDTRTFTGRCASFEEVQCFRWKTGCGNCPKGGLYWPSYIDNTSLEWKLRKQMFAGIKKLTVITPSQWLANHVKDSFFKDKDILVLHNGIDTTTFSKPTAIEINALKSIKGKILLGVAVGWEHRKGLDSMIWLSKHLSEEYQIVLVGGIRDDLQNTVPSNIICLPRTNSKEELIALYQAADVFVNPTLADNFPTVNIEALGAGLPVVTFKTGGSAECIDETSGIGVEKGDNEALLKAIVQVCEHPEIYSKENCIKRSKEFSLSQFDKYIELYHSLVHE